MPDCLEQSISISESQIDIGATTSDAVSKKSYGTTEFGKKLSLLSRLPYCFRTFPDQLLREWEAFKKFKTAPVNRARASIARKGKWREEDDTKPGSAQHMREFLASFFGYLALPTCASKESLASISKLGIKDETRRKWAIECMQGKGLDPNHFSLAYLSDADLVLDHMEFMRHRTKAYSQATLYGLGIIIALLREGTGYLRQQPAFGLLLPKPIKTTEEWDAWCAKNLRILAQAGRDLIQDDEVILSRDPMEPIADILALRSPVNALFELAEKIKADSPSEKTSKLALAIHFRNYLFATLLPYFPLRIKHYSDMRLEENLYRTAEGAWRIYFPAKAFKNERGMKKKDYDVPVDKSLWPLLDEYVDTHRPQLYGGTDKKGFVFLKERDVSSSTATQPTRISQRAFRQLLYRLTEKHLGSKFGPHAVRHIVATTVLKIHPNDWAKAAKALHDTEETVKKRYAHLEVAEGVAEVNEFISGIKSVYSAG